MFPLFLSFQHFFGYLTVSPLISHYVWNNEVLLFQIFENTQILLSQLFDNTHKLIFQIFDYFRSMVASGTILGERANAWGKKSSWQRP